MSVTREGSGARPLLGGRSYPPELRTVWDRQGPWPSVPRGPDVGQLEPGGGWALSEPDPRSWEDERRSFPFTLCLGERASLAPTSIFETVINVLGIWHRSVLKESQDALQSCDPAETVGHHFRDLLVLSIV